MVKSARKKGEKTMLSKKVKGFPDRQETAAEYVGYLLELHKLQGVLLNRLNKKIR